MDPFGFGRIISDKWDILMMSPGAFFAVLGFGFVLGLAVTRAFLNERLTRQQMRIADLEKVLEGKLAISHLQPPQGKRSKQMSIGLILIFVGLGAAATGALVILFDRSPSPTKMAGSVSAHGGDLPSHPLDNPYISWNKAPEIFGSVENNIISVTEIGQTGVSEAPKEFELQDAHIISKNTGARLDLAASTNEGMVPVRQLNNIPPKASLTLRVQIEPRIPERQFLRDWGNYDFVYKIEGKEFRRHVIELDITSAFEDRRAQMDSMNGVNRGPRVTKRN